MMPTCTHNRIFGIPAVTIILAIITLTHLPTISGDVLLSSEQDEPSIPVADFTWCWKEYEDPTMLRYCLDMAKHVHTEGTDGMKEVVIGLEDIWSIRPHVRPEERLQGKQLLAVLEHFAQHNTSKEELEPPCSPMCHIGQIVLLILFTFGCTMLTRHCIGLEKPTSHPTDATRHSRDHNTESTIALRSRGPIGGTRLSFITILMLSFLTLSIIPSLVAAQDNPYICLEETAVAYDCNCHSCNCDTCFSCGCSASLSSCSHGSCGGSGCWCSPICSCCRSSDCGYPCRCSTCCESCVRLDCTSKQSYYVSYILPSEGPLQGGSAIILHGQTYSDTGAIMCKIGEIIVPGVFVDSERVNCTAPTTTTLGTATVELSLNGGTNWTSNGLTFEYKDCSATPCTSPCEPGLAGSTCTLHCADSCIAQDHGTCVTQILQGQERAFCSCYEGWWSDPSSATLCDAACPGGTDNPCNWHGSCDSTTGVCECDSIHFGEACEHDCPGLTTSPSGIIKPCSGHGLCSPLSGKCTCVQGWFGSICSQQCPGSTPDGATVCSGHGICFASTGACQCNPPYSGPGCETVTCPGAPTPCSGHGTCDQITGVCTCIDEWTDSQCATPPAPSEAVHGSIGFTVASVSVTESVGTVELPMIRAGGLKGSIVATVSTIPGSALPGADYVPFSNMTVQWEDQEGGGKNLSVILISDSVPESIESFQVQIMQVDGLGVVGSISLVTVTISESASPSTQSELAQISLVLLIPFSASTESQVITDFTSELSTALGIQGVKRVTVQSIDSASSSSTAITFLLLSDPASEQSIHDLTSKFMKQGFLLLPDKGIFAGLSVLGKIDYTNSPTIFLHADDEPAPDEGGKRGKGWIVGLVLGLIFFLLLLTCGIIAYVKRVPLSEWLMYKLGSFRFTKFRSNEVPQDEGDGGVAEDDSALSPTSDSRHARGGPTELALRMEEERGGTLLVD